MVHTPATFCRIGVSALVVGLCTVVATACQVDDLEDTSPPTAATVQQATVLPTPDTLAATYASILGGMLSLTGHPNHLPLQTFGGALVLAEHAPIGGHFLAGHLGSFVAPPFHSGAAPSDAGDPTDTGFSTGLIFRSNGNPAGFYETPSSSSGTWYPSRLRVSNGYATQGISVSGEKVALPDQRGFALRVTVTAQKAQQDFKVAIVARVPHLSRDNGSWNWGYKGKTAGTIMSAAQRSDGTIIVSSPNQNAKLILGMPGHESWQVGNLVDIASRFRTDPLKRLANSNARSLATSDAELTVAFTSNMGNMAIGASRTFTIYGYVGSTDAELVQMWNGRPADPIRQAQTAWDTQWISLFSRGLPSVTTGNATLNGQYYRSALQYLMNRWRTDAYWNNYYTASDSVDTNRFVAFGNLRANSVAFFQWTQGTEQFLAMANPTQWRKELLHLVRAGADAVFDRNKPCRTFAPLGSDLCDKTYYYSRTSLVRAVYRYVAVSSDTGILNEWVGSRRLGVALADMINQWDDELGSGSRLVGAGKLYNFANDDNLFEHNLGCTSFGGFYTGKVVSPNAERHMAHLMLAEMFDRVTPGSGADHRGLAARNKNAVNSTALWNATERWYNQREGSNSTVYFQPMLHVLGYPELLDADKRIALLSHVPDFRGTYGFYSIAPRSNKSCDARPDWHGPGLYSGNVGMFLRDLFFDLPDYAYDRLTIDYARLAQQPIWAQSFRATRKELEPERSWYLESISVAEAVVAGIMGLQPRPNETWLRPRIPERLRTSGARFSNAIAQTHRWSITAAAGQNDAISIAAGVAKPTVTRVPAFRFGWEGTRTSTVTLSNMVSKTYRVSRVVGGTETTLVAAVAANASGVLTFTLRPSDTGLIKVQ